MPIHASLVARGNVVLAEYYPPGSNFPTVARGLIEKIPSTPDSKKSYSFDNYNFHYMVENKITYLCMTDSDMGLTVPYSFLFDVSAKFRGMYGDKSMSASALAMNDSFGRILSDRMGYFSNDRNANQITRIRGEIEDAKDIMVKNLDKVLERGSKIEMLVDKTENLQEHSQSFKKKSTRLKRNMWWKNFKLCFLLAIILLLIVGGVVTAVCWKTGVFDHSGGSGGGGHNNSTTSATTDITTTTTGDVTTGGTTTGGTTPTPTSSPTPSKAPPSSSSTPSSIPSPTSTPSSSSVATPSTAATPTTTPSTNPSPSVDATPSASASASASVTPSTPPIDTTANSFF